MRILILSLFVVIADQVSKLMVKGIDLPGLGVSLQGVQLGSSRQILGDFLRLTYIENPGMAFGIDIGGKLFFSIFSILASIGILLYIYKARKEHLAFRIALALILGGAVGNLIDRVFYGVIFNEGPLFYGRVVDFIDADFFNISLFGYHLSRWPVFNLADASVTCGVLLMLLTHRRALKAGQPSFEGGIGSAEAIGNNGSSVLGTSFVPPDSPASSSSQNDSPQA